jgi:DNA polymerase I-like protein with 3'-5' exonuclease and polymerase domains
MLDNFRPEWRVALFLSQDKVGIAELLTGSDLHTDNQNRFKLGEGKEGRLVAKTFLFRLLYGGSAFSYANDPSFTKVSKSEKFWQRVIDGTYEKYPELARWHTKIVQEAIETGKVKTPFGREFVYEDPMKQRTQILNFSVQGTGADVMMVARISAYRRLKGISGISLINTVHDSIVCDVSENNLDKCCEVLYSVFVDLPKNLSKMFNLDWNVPLTCEIEYGPNNKEMTEWLPKS